MKKMFLFVLGICLVVDGATCYATVGNDTVPGEIGRFVALRGANGTNGTNGTDACPPLISSDTKNAQGCFVVKQKSQVRNTISGNCEATGSWSTIDTVCDCRPSETRTPCGHGSEEACGTAGRAGYKIVTTQCDGTGSTTSYIYDNNCGVTVDSVTDVHQTPGNSTTPVVAKRVSFRNTCEANPLSTTADIPVGEDGANCQAEVVVTACGPSETVLCDSATKQGVRIQKKDCSGSIVTASTQYIYNGDAGAACNATITTERCGPTLTTKCYENGSESQKAGVKITKTDCSGDNATSAYTYDGEVGTGIYYQGELNDCSALTALKNNSSVTKEPGYAWFVKDLGTGYDAGKLYIWTNNDFPLCPSGGVPFQGPQGAQGEGICDGVADLSVAIKNTVRSYEGPTSSARGYMKLHHTKCNDSTADDQIKDECVPIIAASAATCAGTYLECKPQGTYTGNNNYAKYNVCESTTGTTIASALSNKEDTLCVGTNEQSSSVERKKTVEYTAPSGLGSDGTYTWNTTVGKIVNKSVKCDGSTSTISSTPDKCEEIARPNANVCTGTGNVYYQCTRSDNATTYNLCAAGNSILANVVGKTEVSNNYTAPVITSASNYTIGYLTMSVGGTSVPVSDTCVAIAKSGTTTSLSGQKCKCGGTTSSGVCASSNSTRMYCVGINSTGDCDTGIVEIGDVLDSATTAVSVATNAANAVSGKLDASALTVGSDGTLSYGTSCSTNIVGVTTEQKSAVNDVTYWYRKYRVNTTCPTTNITPNGTGAKLYNWLDNFCSQGGTGYSYNGTLGIGDGSAKVGDACYNNPINSGKFDLFVRIDDSDSMLSSLNNKVESSDLTNAVNSAVAGAVEDQEFNFGSNNMVNMKLSEIIEMLGQVVGNCTSINDGTRTEVSCSGGSLNNLSIERRQN